MSRNSMSEARLGVASSGLAGMQVKRKRGGWGGRRGPTEACQRRRGDRSV